MVVIFVQDRSNIQMPGCKLGPIVKNGGGWVIKDLLIRWNERTEIKQTEQGEQTEYIYDAYRFDYQLPVEVEPGIESVTYYLEAAKTEIIQLAQAIATQEAGFNA
jgi:hypothetical protein